MLGLSNKVTICTITWITFGWGHCVLPYQMTLQFLILGELLVTYLALELISQLLLTSLQMFFYICIGGICLATRLALPLAVDTFVIF